MNDKAKKKLILVADDDAEFVTLLRARLESAGFETVAAYEGVRTIEAAHKRNPDIIILDWKMPTGMGSDVLSDLKTHNGTKKTPVIVLTGVDDSSLEEASMKMGANAFMRKPYDAKTLIQKINEILQWKKFQETAK